HFRGFAAAWHIPAGAPTAQSGRWVPGPSAGLFGAVEKALGRLPFVAEDLGMITPDVVALPDQLHVPGTRGLQFAFDAHSDPPCPTTTSPTRSPIRGPTTIRRRADGMRIFPMASAAICGAT